VIGRYRIVRGRRLPDDPLPDGVRQDTRKHTRHVLRPAPEAVESFLRAPGETGFARFRQRYLELLRGRAERDAAAFDALARLGRDGDLFLGCNCPTRRQPDVKRCHTWLALEFLAHRYPDLDCPDLNARPVAAP
jgi:hypothetical protein